jgi:hypothetical protein
MVAARDIEVGEEIYISYNQCIDCYKRHYTFGTPEMFRDYGFVEQYPQRWIFHKQDVAFDIDEVKDRNGKLEVIWLDESVHKEFGNLYEATNWGMRVLKSHLQRLKTLFETDLKPIAEGTSDIEVPEHELEPLMTYYHALTTALQVATDDYFEFEDDNDDDDDEDVEGDCRAG